MRRCGGVPVARAGRGGEGGTALFRAMGAGVRRGGGTAFVGEGVTSQGRRISRWRRPSSWVRGARHRERGMHFQNFKWCRAHFILTPSAGCLRYFEHVSLPRNFHTRARIGAQARKIRRERI